MKKFILSSIAAVIFAVSLSASAEDIVYVKGSVNKDNVIVVPHGTTFPTYVAVGEKHYYCKTYDEVKPGSSLLGVSVLGLGVGVGTTSHVESKTYCAVMP